MGTIIGRGEYANEEMEGLSDVETGKGCGVNSNC